MYAHVCVNFYVKKIESIRSPYIGNQKALYLSGPWHLAQVNGPGVWIIVRDMYIQNIYSFVPLGLCLIAFD